MLYIEGKQIAFNFRKNKFLYTLCIEGIIF